MRSEADGIPQKGVKNEQCFSGKSALHAGGPSTPADRSGPSLIRACGPAAFFYRLFSAVLRAIALAAGPLIYICMPAMAAEVPSALVRTRIEPAAGVAIGQPATLYVDVFTDSFFTSGVELPALIVPGAVIRLSDERPSHISETIRGTNWVGIEHKYSITPIVAADLTIPAFEVGVHLGPQSQPTTLTGKSTTLKVSIPAGADGAFVTHDLRMNASTDADVSHLKVGDAFTRSIELIATGTPAMFIPDVALDAPPGLKAYPHEPTLSDAPPGSPVKGRRTFSATYVVQRAGDYQLPSSSVRWWDLDTRRIETAEIPALSVHAEAAAATAPPFAVPAQQAPPPPRRIDWRRIAIVVAAALALLCTSWWLAPHVRRLGRKLIARRHAQHLRHLDSERHAFSQLQATLHGDGSHAAAALYHWLDRVPADKTATHGAATTSLVEDREFRIRSAALLQRLYGGGRTDASAAARDLRRSLRDARRTALKHTGRDARSVTLPIMNP